MRNDSKVREENLMVWPAAVRDAGPRFATTGSAVVERQVHPGDELAGSGGDELGEVYRVGVLGAT